MFEDNEVFIHVGIPKTATSFFQKIVFPRISNIKFISNPYTQLNTAFNMIQYADDTLYDDQVVIKELSRYSEFKKILISEESFSGSIANLMGGNRTQNAKRLQKLFPKARIILFIRGQKDILYSAYNQYVKTHHGKRRMGHYFRFANLNDIYTTNKKATNDSFMNFAPNHSHIELFKYYALIKLYKSLFEQVDVFLYEDFCSNPQKIMDRFEAIFKENINDKSTINFAEKVNRSLEKKEIEKHLFYNKSRFLFRKKKISDFFFFLNKIKYSNKILQKENDFNESMIKNYFREDNRKIIEEFPEIKMDRYPEKYDL